MKSTKRHAFATIRLHSRRSVSMIWSANLVDGRPLIALPRVRTIPRGSTCSPKMIVSPIQGGAAC